MEGITIKRANDNDVFSNKMDYEDVSRNAVGKLFDGIKAKPETLVSGYKDFSVKNKENTGQNRYDKRGTALKPDNEMESSNRFNKVRGKNNTKFKEPEPDLEPNDYFDDYASSVSNMAQDNQPTPRDDNRATSIRTPKILSDLSQTPSSHSAILRELQEKIQLEKQDTERVRSAMKPAISTGDSKIQKVTLGHTGNLNEVVDDEDYEMSLYRKPAQRDVRNVQNRPPSNPNFQKKVYPKPNISNLMKPKKEEGFKLSAAPRPLKIAVLSVFVVILIVLAALIFKINSDNTALDQALSTEENSPYAAKISALELGVERLEQRIAELTVQVDKLNTLVLPEESLPPQDPDAPDATDGTNTATGDRTYTVKGGDSLSKIATEFYGSSSEANINKIKAANGLTSNNIRAGNTLKIPQ